MEMRKRLETYFFGLVLLLLFGQISSADEDSNKNGRKIEDFFCTIIKPFSTLVPSIDKGIHKLDIPKIWRGKTSTGYPNTTSFAAHKTDVPTVGAEVDLVWKDLMVDVQSVVESNSTYVKEITSPFESFGNKSFTDLLMTNVSSVAKNDDGCVNSSVSSINNGSEILLKEIMEAVLSLANTTVPEVPGINSSVASVKNGSFPELQSKDVLSVVSPNDGYLPGINTSVLSVQPDIDILLNQMMKDVASIVKSIDRHAQDINSTVLTVKD